MRTTLDIDEPVLRDLRQLQTKEGGTLGQVASRLLAEALAGRARKSSRPAFEWSAQPVGARIDLADRDTVYSILRDGD